MRKPTLSVSIAYWGYKYKGIHYCIVVYRLRFKIYEKAAIISGLVFSVVVFLLLRPLSKEEVAIDGIKFAVEIADEPEEQIRGLSNRESLPENEGMLFIFNKPGIYDFWMKNMNFPIDIIWASADKKIIGIEENILPGTFPKTFSPPSPIKYALEANAGWAKKNKIVVGEKIEP